MTEAQEIGQRIRKLRLKNNMTQQELAEKLQYKSRSTINKIELGINEIHPTKLRAFAFALNTSLDYILGWSKDPNVYENKIVITLEDGRIIQQTFNKEKIDIIIKLINNLKG